MEYDKLTPEQLEQLATVALSSNKPLNLGPFILGNAIDALLCGIMLMQWGSYINSPIVDHWPLRIAVAYIMVMSLFVILSPPSSITDVENSH
ncbi:hypothetical protein RhiJN_18218 [Ceratobasidium sp. AG-Ba]|nr:hypothetical protein RhiJN_18218 [Ceratobasidium sp. AG-Ba]